jgi:hypothetical protein
MTRYLTRDRVAIAAPLADISPAQLKGSHSAPARFRTHLGTLPWPMRCGAVASESAKKRASPTFSRTRMETS